MDVLQTEFEHYRIEKLPDPTTPDSPFTKSKNCDDRFLSNTCLNKEQICFPVKMNIHAYVPLIHMSYKTNATYIQRRWA